MNGLIIKPKYADMIYSGSKTWELRSRSTNIRGDIALIKSGSGRISGVCDLIGVRGPFRPTDLIDASNKTAITDIDAVLAELSYEVVYAWEIRNVRILKYPKPYSHPLGAITWVRLPDGFLERKHMMHV